MSRTADYLAETIADGLNEYAGYMAREEMMPRHTPGSPAFWFYGLAREQAALCRSPKFRKLLTADARKALNAKPSWWGRAKVSRVNGILRQVA